MEDIFEVLEQNERIEFNKVISILESNDADYFLTQYNFFNDDAKYYEKYIERRISLDLKDKELIILVDLANIINYHKESFIADLMKNALLKRKPYMLILSILDYFNKFYSIPVINNNYVKFNVQLNNSTNNSLVKFQTAVNLLIMNNKKYVICISRTLQKTRDPAYFYRYINTVFYYKHFFALQNIIDFKKMILESKHIREVVKLELLRILEDSKIQDALE